MSNNPPAFPFSSCGTQYKGLSLRDYAAIEFIAARISNSGTGWPAPEGTIQGAFKFADAFLEARKP